MCLSYVGGACWVSLRGGIDTGQGHQMLVHGLLDIGKRCEVDASQASFMGCQMVSKGLMVAGGLGHAIN